MLCESTRSEGAKLRGAAVGRNQFSLLAVFAVTGITAGFFSQILLLAPKAATERCLRWRERRTQSRGIRRDLASKKSPLKSGTE